jgi:hypothetical protein
LSLLLFRYPGEGPSSNVSNDGTPNDVDPYPKNTMVTVIPGSGSDTHSHYMAMYTGTVVSRLDEENYMVREHKEQARKKGKKVHRDKMTVWVEPGVSPGNRGPRYSDLSEKDKEKFRKVARLVVPSPPPPPPGK